MHFRKYFLAAVMVALLASCNQADKRETPIDSSSITGKQSETREDVLYRQTMDIHNEVMAKMGKLNGYRKKVQQQSDSIRSMLASTDFTIPMAQRIAKDLDSLDVLGKKLQMADSAMNAWMEGFDPDPKLPTSDAKADYFEQQKQSALTMKKIFFDALSQAENLFASPK